MKLHACRTNQQRGRIFVGGPIQNAMTANGFDDDLRFTLVELMHQLEARGFEVLSAHRAENFGDGDNERFTPNSVTTRDRSWMQIADVYLCVLPTYDDGSLVISGGTHIELGWASALLVPILILWRVESKAKYSHLVRGLAAVANVKYLPLNCVANGNEEILDAIERLLQEQKPAITGG